MTRKADIKSRALGANIEAPKVEVSSSVKQKRLPSVTQGDIAADMRVDKVLFGKFGQNVLDGGFYVRGKLPWSANDELRRWDDADEAYLFSYEQERLGTGSREDVKGAFKMLCTENKFNPIADMLDNLPVWDRRPRAKYMLCALFGAANNAYTQAVSELWMRGAVRRGYEPGCKFDYTLVLKGTQGIKKSLTGRRLAMREEFFCETVSDITQAKTTAEQISGKWIVEIGELSGIKGKGLEAVKASLTAQKVTVRLAYAHFPVDQLRSCVFVATTNERDFLIDRTGNRRFLPVECAVEGERKGCELASGQEIRTFIEQAWAEVVYHYKVARCKALTEDEFLKLYPLMLDEEGERLANQEREDSTEEDTRIGVIDEWLKRQIDCIPPRVCSRMVAMEALKLNEEMLERDTKITKRIAQILDEHFPEWVREKGKQRCGSYGTQRVWVYRPLASVEA